MTYGLWNIMVTILYVVLAIGGVVVIMGAVVSFLLTFIPESKCNGDCEQGRRCTCEEKK
jgi:ABC-type protease/lipase transport system fused ATPase/permease subunit